LQGKSVRKFGFGSRATFVSPYLRRPLRPLDKVLSERDDQATHSGPALVVGDGTDEATSATWSNVRKPAATSD
jgi:hypothetical protein